MKQEKEKKTKRIPLWKTLTVVFLLLGIFVAVGYSTFIAGPVVDTSSTIQTSGETETDDSDMVRVDFKYQICDGMEVVTYDPEPLGDVNGTSYSDMTKEYTTTNENNYNTFQNLMNTLTGSRPGDITTIGQSKFVGVNDWSDYLIVVDVIDGITFTEGICSDTYTGKYRIWKIHNDETSYTYSYSTDTKFSLEIAKGNPIPNKVLLDYIDNKESNYTFVNMVSGAMNLEGEEVPGTEVISFDTPINSDMSVYIVMNSNVDLAEYKTNLSQTISNATGEITINGFSAESPYNVTEDLSYFESDKTVMLTQETHIHEGVTVNFGLNDGNITKTATGDFSNYEPENEKHELQYKVVLQDDMIIDGTLKIGSNYGVNTANANQGMIANEYVCLDLNGHDITVNANGALLSYGLIKDSKGTGSILINGGKLLTLAVVEDYHGGRATRTMVSDEYVFPFQVYLLPYLRCHARILKSEDGIWGQFLALAHICAQTTGGTTYAEPVLNFIGPSNSSEQFLFSLEEENGTNSYVDIIGYSHSQMEEEMTAADRQYVLSSRMKIVFEGVSCVMNSLQLDVIEQIDTGDYIFPISGFFDIVLNSSNIVISQRIKFMPGSSFFADEKSIIALSYTNDYSAQISVLDKSYNYYDPSCGSKITNDNAAGGGTTFGERYLNSDAYLKYFSGSRTKIFGTIAFKAGNTRNPYILAGNIDFNKIAYYTDDYNQCVEIEYTENENPFTKIVNANQNISIRTYNFSTILGQNYNTSLVTADVYHNRGYVLPLVSHDKCYYQNGTETEGMVGTFDSLSGEMIFDNNPYYFNCDGSYQMNDQRSCSLRQCTYNSDKHVFIDGEKTYIYFASMYFEFTETGDFVGTANTERLNNQTKSTNVRFDSTLNRWLRA